MKKFQKQNLASIIPVRKTVHVPEFETCIKDGVVCVEQLSVRDKAKVDAFIMEHTKYEEKKKGRFFVHKSDQDLVAAHIVITCVCDDTGEKIFDESDIELILGLPASCVKRILDAYEELNEPKPEEIEEAGKN